MSRENCKRKTITPGRQHSASMSLSSQIRTYIRTLTHSPVAGISVQHPRSLLRSESRRSLRQGTGRRDKLSTFMKSSGSTGALETTSSPYWVSHYRQPARADLITKDRGRCRWKTWSVSRTTILCKQHRTYLSHYPSLPATNFA